MKRFHVHVAVADLVQSIKFYSTLFAIEPTTRKPDYAKWMLENPRVNFAISQRGAASGIEHLGIQAETEEEAREVFGRLAMAGGIVVEEKATTCCYAKSDKQWIADPSGISWETFLTHGEATLYGGGPAAGEGESNAACCASSCCTPEANELQPLQQAARAASGCCAAVV